MQFDIEALSAPPPKYFKFGAFGLEKRGKTTICMKLAALLARRTGDRIALLDTENMRTDWYDRIVGLTGHPPVIFPQPEAKGQRPPKCTPEMALQFAEWCEAQPEIGILVIDSMTEILSFPREQWVQKNGKGIPVHMYAKIDGPYKRLSEWVKGSSLHVLATMREGNDQQTVDDVEQVIGKKGKAGGFEYVPRVMAHCSLRKSKGTNIFVTEIRDCSKESVIRIDKKDGDERGLTAADLEPVIARFFEEERVAA